VTTITPIGQLDYRLPQAGRIRTGEKTKSRGGKQIPRALNFFRFTSGERELIDVVADRYGGTTKPFDAQGSGDKWMVDTEADVIDVILAVPKGFSLAYELWNPHLVRRCNGETCDVLVETPDDAEIQQQDCLCARRGVLECSTKLRVAVLLPNMPTLGAWRWDTESDNAIKEVRGVFKALNDWVGPGLHPCKMRLEERRHPGKKFKVVVLDPGISVESLVAGDARLVQLPTPAPPRLGELEAGASSVTHTSSTPEAGEPMAGEAGEVEPAPPVGSSPASPPTVRANLMDPLTGEIYKAEGDDDIVDAEVIEDLTDASPHMDEQIDVDACRTWLAATKASGRLSSKALIQGRKLSIEAGLPAPMTIDDLTVEIIDQLRKAGDDEHPRERSPSH
jgi:hypothetical protein